MALTRTNNVVDAIVNTTEVITYSYDHNTLTDKSLFVATVETLLFQTKPDQIITSPFEYIKYNGLTANVTVFDKYDNYDVYNAGNDPMVPIVHSYLFVLVWENPKNGVNDLEFKYVSGVETGNNRSNIHISLQSYDNAELGNYVTQPISNSTYNRSEPITGGEVRIYRNSATINVSQNSIINSVGRSLPLFSTIGRNTWRLLGITIDGVTYKSDRADEDGYIYPSDYDMDYLLDYHRHDVAGFGNTNVVLSSGEKTCWCEVGLYDTFGGDSYIADSDFSVIEIKHVEGNPISYDINIGKLFIGLD